MKGDKNGMKEEYVSPEMEIVEFEEDVITTSCPTYLETEIVVP